MGRFFCIKCKKKKENASHFHFLPNRNAAFHLNSSKKLIYFLSAVTLYDFLPSF